MPSGAAAFEDGDREVGLHGHFAAGEGDAAAGMAEEWLHPDGAGNDFLGGDGAALEGESAGRARLDATAANAAMLPLDCMTAAVNAMHLGTTHGRAAAAEDAAVAEEDDLGTGEDAIRGCGTICSAAGNP